MRSLYNRWESRLEVVLYLFLEVWGPAPETSRNTMTLSPSVSGTDRTLLQLIPLVKWRYLQVKTIITTSNFSTTNFYIRISQKMRNLLYAYLVFLAECIMKTPCYGIIFLIFWNLIVKVKRMDKLLCACKNVTGAK